LYFLEKGKIYKNEEFNRELLVSVIEPFIRLTLDGKILPTEKFEELSDGRKIVSILLAKKVLKDDGIIENEKTRVNELVQRLSKERSSIEGQIYGALKDLVLVEQGDISIPNFRIKKAKEFLGVKDGDK
jgi:hypothetical protein